MHTQSLSHVWLFETPWTVAHPSTWDSVHGILQARILEWVAVPSSGESSWLRDWTCFSCIGRWILYHWTTREAPPVGYRVTNMVACRLRPAHLCLFALWYLKLESFTTFKIESCGTHIQISVFSGRLGQSRPQGDLSKAASAELSSRCPWGMCPRVCLLSPTWSGYWRLLEITTAHRIPSYFPHQPDAVFPKQPGQVGISIPVLPVR